MPTFLRSWVITDNDNVAFADNHVFDERWCFSGRSHGAAATAGGEEDGSSGGVEENARGVQSDGRTEAAAAR